MKILIIDDNKGVTENISEYLDGLNKGFDINIAHDGPIGLHKAITHKPDFIILDLMLPVINGENICKFIKKKIKQPPYIMMLSAKDKLNDRLKGFEHGADDYLTKPFSLKEIYYKIEAYISRMNKPTNIIFEDIEINVSSLEVRVNNKLIDSMTMSQRKILLILIRNPYSFISKNKLRKEIWENRPISDVLIRKNIHAVRSKIDNKDGASWITTEYRHGYKINTNKKK